MLLTFVSKLFTSKKLIVEIKNVRKVLHFIPAEAYSHQERAKVQTTSKVICKTNRKTDKTGNNSHFKAI